MVIAEAQRTLVKSPPELWGELSDPDALARHLGELGEIRIVRTSPEQSVEWEARDTRGMVEIKPAGWGTKVTLSVTIDHHDEAARAEAARAEAAPAKALHAREEPQVAEPATDEAPAHAEPNTAAEPPAVELPRAVAPPPAADASASNEPEPAEREMALAPAPEPLAPERGLLAFFRRLRRGARAMRPRERGAEPNTRDDPLAGLMAPPPPPAEPSVDAEPHPTVDPVAEPGVEPLLEDTSESAEQEAAEHATAVLSAVLDRLGEAHHRPFSRS